MAFFPTPEGPEKSSDTLSRLKGIETKLEKGEQMNKTKKGSDTLSRLKGIETHSIQVQPLA